MYIWKVNNLVEDFKRGEVNGKEQFKYFLLFTLASNIMLDLLIYEYYRAYTVIDIIDNITTLCITIGGIYYCYKKNEKGDNKDFIVRAFCLGIPIGGRIFAIFFPLMIFIYALTEMDTLEEGNVIEIEVYYTKIWEVIVGNIFILFFYLYLGKKIEEIAVSKDVKGDLEIES